MFTFHRFCKYCTMKCYSSTHRYHRFHSITNHHHSFNSSSITYTKSIYINLPSLSSFHTLFSSITTSHFHSHPIPTSKHLINTFLHISVITTVHNFQPHKIITLSLQLTPVLSTPFRYQSCSPTMGHCSIVFQLTITIILTHHHWNDRQYQCNLFTLRYLHWLNISLPLQCLFWLVSH